LKKRAFSKTVMHTFDTIKMKKDIFDKLRAYAESTFKCGLHSIHGFNHWQNVDDSARLICEDSQADLVVVRFFAFLHDAFRVNDGSDLDHDPRSADNLDKLPEELSILRPDQLNLLEYAIRHHTDGNTSEDPTIGACWDSDRLDLGRVGIIPIDRFMSTQAGKEIARLGSKLLYMEKKN
jgi:uncharacterized protein